MKDEPTQAEIEALSRELMEARFTPSQTNPNPVHPIDLCRRAALMLQAWILAKQQRNNYCDNCGYVEEFIEGMDNSKFCKKCQTELSEPGPHTE